jgi:hypothetical protein
MMMRPSWKKDYLVGLDLGQAQDFTALALIEKVWVSLPEYDGNTLKPKVRVEYHLQHLERMLGVSYPQQVQRVKERLGHPDLRIHTPTLIIDRTGVGAAVCDLFQAAGVWHWQVSIHGGAKVTKEGMCYHVPKRDLVAAVNVCMQQRTLKIAEALPERSTLTTELQNFRVTIDPRTAHDSYAAWREKDHDDLVLAVALAVWFGEHGGGPAVACNVRF